jgi:cytochrome c oxidase cbb3-type subunit III
MRVRGIFGLLCLLIGTVAFAQHETGADVFSGEQAFQNYCANCHGKTGNQVANADLSHGVFRKPYNDGELANIVMHGIAGTPMPATPNMSSEQATQIVAYLRSRAVSKDNYAEGDAVRGGVLFAGKGQCFACHRILGAGSRQGPDLSRIGLLRTTEQLATSLLNPDSEVQPGNRSYSVTTQDGQRISGRLLNHDNFTVQLLDSNEQLQSFLKADVTEETFIPSPMPSVRGRLDDGEISDLVQYLVTLRGAEKK